MTTKELLKPRWKVIADYPNNSLRIGEIIESTWYDVDETIPCALIDGNYIFVKNYPAIFKKLEWWEKREIEDMPKYIRVEHTVPIPKYQKLNGIYKVGEYISDGFIPDKGDGIKSISFNKWVFPATEQEYLNQ